MNLCKYKDIFGKPKEGIHSYRLFNLAISDIVLTIIASYIISQITNFDYMNVLIITFIIGILLHKVFCVSTTINNIIFGND